MHRSAMARSAAVRTNAASPSPVVQGSLRGGELLCVFECREAFADTLALDLKDNLETTLAGTKIDRYNRRP